MKGKGKVVSDSDSDDEIVNNAAAAEGGEDDMSEKTESDCEVESSEEELGVVSSKKVS